MSAQSATQELVALWSATFGGPPAVKASARELAQILVHTVKPAPPYEPASFAPAAEQRRAGFDQACPDAINAAAAKSAAG